MFVEVRPMDFVECIRHRPEDDYCGGEQASIRPSEEPVQQIVNA